MSDALHNEKHLLSLLQEAGHLSMQEDQVHLSETLWPLFLGEKTVPLSPASPQSFFWQRLCRWVADTEPVFFRFSLAADAWPEELLELKPPVWIFWNVAHFETPRLVEEPVVLALDSDHLLRVSPDILQTCISSLQAGRRSFTPEEVSSVFSRMQSGVEPLLESRVRLLQEEMAQTLKTELGRIDQYYEQLLKSRRPSEETRFMIQERDQLVREHHRRFSPENLRIRIRTDFGCHVVQD